MGPRFSVSLAVLSIFALQGRGLAFVFPYAPSAEDGGLAGSYLYGLAPGGRSFAMGKTSLAARDVTATYMNPSGLTRLISKEVSLFFTQLNQDANLSFFAFGYPFTERNTFGLSWIRYSVGGVEQVSASGVGLGSTSDDNSAYYLSYAFGFRPRLSIGTTFKVVTQSLAGYSGIGFGLDMGLDFVPLGESQDWILSWTFQNVLPPSIKLREAADRFPTNIVLGSGYRFLGNRAHLLAQLEMLDLFPESGSRRPFRWHAGGEYFFYKDTALRLGIDYSEVTFGLGLLLRDFQLDYGAGMHALGIRHSFGITFKFGLLLTEQEKRVEKRKKEVDLEQMYQEALGHYNAGSHELAIQAAESALKVFGNERRILSVLGKARLALRGKKALELGEQALDLYLENKQALGQAKMNEALELDAQVKERLVQTHFKAAKTLLEASQYKAAQEELAKVIWLDPNHAEAKVLLKKVQSILEIMK